MTYAAAIKGIPNSPNGLAAIEKLKVAGMTNWKRGRGHRWGHNTGGYAQSLPAHLAGRFTLYTYPKDATGFKNYTKCRYIVTEPNGKIRLRMET
jgi:hypothetical protein